MKILISEREHKFGLPQLIRCWKNKGFCEIEYIDEKFIWIENVGDIILWSRDRFSTDVPPFELGLIGNRQTPKPNTVPWIYWAQHPEILEKHKKALRSKRKTFDVGWCGARIKRRLDILDWLKHCDRQFISSEGCKLRLQEYLVFMGSLKFGISLPGWGPKCHRDIEMMALGTVPILTPGCCTKYHNPPIENVHYLKANKPEDIPELINNADWESMSAACIEWYEENCSIDGSFKVTTEILHKYNK